MPRFDKTTEDPATSRQGQELVALDERFVTMFLDDTPLDRVESQELRQIVMRALQGLTPSELKVVETRYQLKNSPGATAARLRLPKEEVAALEQSALNKLSKPLIEYMES